MAAVHFTVLCIGSMTQATASAALATVPSDLFTFSFGTPVEGTNWTHAYPGVFSNQPGQGDLPVPLTDYTLCLSNPGDWPNPGLNLGTTLEGTRRCGVYNYDSYFSAVILHELLHTLPVPNGDELRTNLQFNQWVRAVHPTHPYLADPSNYADHSEFMVLGNEYLVHVARGEPAPSAPLAPTPTISVGDPVNITRPSAPMAPGDTIASSISSPDGATKVFVSYTSPVSLSGTANPIDNLLDQYVDWLLGSMIRMFQFFDGSAEFWRWLQGMGFGWMWPWFMLFAQFGEKFARGISPEGYLTGWQIVAASSMGHYTDAVVQLDSGDIYAVSTNAVGVDPTVFTPFSSVSHDGGLTWEPATAPPYSGYVVDGVFTGGETFVVIIKDQLWRWNGASWACVLSGANDGGGFSRIIHTRYGYIYLDGLQNNWINGSPTWPTPSNCWRSPDGVSWTKVGALPYSIPDGGVRSGQIYDVVEMQNGTLIACGNAGIFASTDGGATWGPRSPTKLRSCVSINNVLISTGVRSNDGGYTFVHNSDGSPYVPVAEILGTLAIGVDSNGTILAAGGYNIMMSADTGFTWTIVFSQSLGGGAYNHPMLLLPGGRVIIGLVMTGHIAIHI